MLKTTFEEHLSGNTNRIRAVTHWLPSCWNVVSYAYAWQTVRFLPLTTAALRRIYSMQSE